MSIRFAIKNLSPKAEKEGDSIVRFSGSGEPFRRICDRATTAIGVESNGDSKLMFNTGLDEKKVDFFPWYNEEEKKAVRKTIEDLRPTIVEYYGGEDITKPTNKFFWGSVRDVSRLSLSHADIDVFFDTKNPVHALLYLSIISGAFLELVAPNKEWAERTQTPHYLVLDTDDTVDDEDDITRSDAHAALAKLRQDASPEALFILAWCVQYDTNAFGAYNKDTPVRDLINYHIKYIDGKLVTKKKRNTAVTFLDYVKKWEAQQTRPALYAEAYLKAGEYYGFVNQRSKKFTTSDGTILGNTVEDSVKELMKAKNTKDFESLRDKVEAKWKE